MLCCSLSYSYSGVIFVYGPPFGVCWSWSTRLSSLLADTIVLLSRANPEDPAALCQSVCREPSWIKKRCAKFILEKTFRELTFRGARRIRENRENYVPRKFGTVWYIYEWGDPSSTYNCSNHSVVKSIDLFLQCTLLPHPPPPWPLCEHVFQQLQFTGPHSLQQEYSPDL